MAAAYIGWHKIMQLRWIYNFEEASDSQKLFLKNSKCIGSMTAPKSGEMPQVMTLR